MRTSIFGTDPLELGVNDGNRQEVLARIQADARYVKHFKAVFIDEADPTSWENIIKAIAAFERTLISFLKTLTDIGFVTNASNAAPSP